MAVEIKVSVYTNGDDAFVAWAPSDFIAGCRGFLLERGRKAGASEKIEPVENRVGFTKDKPKSGDHRPSDVWPFQRFNWTDHAADVGNVVRYRVTAMVSAGPGKPLTKGVSSDWTDWHTLATDAGGGFSCYFNRGLVLSQFVARYMAKNKLTPAAFKKSLQTNGDAKFRAFLEGDLGLRMIGLTQGAGDELHAALYELGDATLETALIGLGPRLHLILANASDKKGDGNKDARKNLNDHGIATIDRMLKSKGLGHNKFVVVSEDGEPKKVWTGSTNWSTTGLCTQVNNGLLIEDAAVAAHFRKHWDLLRDASPPKTDPANFTPALMADNDAPKTFTVGAAKATVWFTRTSNGADMAALRDVIGSAKQAVLFLMFTPGKQGLHTLAGQRAREKGMYVRGVVSTLSADEGGSEQNFLDIDLVSSDRKFTPDRYAVAQPQGLDAPLGPWIAEVTRRTFLSQVGHAIVHSKILVTDPHSSDCVVVTGSHNFSAPASERNDENLVIVRGHRKLAAAYATYAMSVYSHYRYRSYIREMRAEGKTPWSYLEDDDQWLKAELRTKAQEIAFWTAQT